MSHRLFIAIRPPSAVRDRLIDTMEGLPGARWQGDGQLHVTLRFVGEVDAPVAEDLAAELARVTLAPFPLALAGVGHFERKGRPHTLWAGLGPSGPLTILQDRIERACRRAGIPPESRRFTPHITLARLNSASAPPGGFIRANAGLAGEPWTVDAFDLMESELGRGGARYDIVRRYRLTRD